MRYDYEKLYRRVMVLGWYQGDIAAKIRKRFGDKEGISQATVSHVLTGKNQSPPTVKKVALVLGVPMEELIVEVKRKVRKTA